jgi:hypothetical protein
MKVVYKLVLGHLLLVLCEGLLLFFFLLLENLNSLNRIYIHVHNAFRHTLELVGLKFIFYTLFWFLACLLIYLPNVRKVTVLNLCIFNCLCYVIISLFYGLTISFTREYFFANFFIYFIVATFLSPKLLSMIPR